MGLNAFRVQLPSEEQQLKRFQMLSPEKRLTSRRESGRDCLAFVFVY